MVWVLGLSLGLGIGFCLGIGFGFESVALVVGGRDGNFAPPRFAPSGFSLSRKDGGARMG